ncbi:MAG: hypothetical protein HQK54_10900, partial [Oligoflexales bacterium]|nr:hypothetical protein [Oligoflexales bacterium]
EIKIYYYKGDIIQKLEQYAKSKSPLSLADTDPAPNSSSDSGGEGGYLDDILGRSGQPQDITWPNLPWTYMTDASGLSNTTTASFGIKGDLFEIVEAANETSLSFMYGVGKQLFLVKRSIDKTYENNLIFKTDPVTGERSLNVVKGQEFIGMCVYKSTVETTFSTASSLKVAGSGVSGTIVAGDQLAFTRFSSFFNIQEGDTLDSLSNMCFDVFSSMVKAPTNKDLNLAILNRLNSLGTALNGDSIQAIIKTALFGGSLKRVKSEGHHWNVKGADIKTEGNNVTVTGRLEHSTAGLLNNEINYNCKYEDSVQTRRDFSYKRRNLKKGWEDNGQNIIDKICHDANITFRQYSK